jgi:uncharacterized membrane protein YfcA
MTRGGSLALSYETRVLDSGGCARCARHASEVMPVEIVWLCGFAFLAGFVDAVVGGGGLIQLPALFLFLPPGMAAAVPAVLGTNKLSSICGTGMALWQYSRRVQIRWHTLWPAAGGAMVCSFLGARAVSSLRPEVVKPVIVGLLVAVAAWTYTRRDFGAHHAPRFAAGHERGWGLAMGLAIGFYDGFFGPGTGSFLMFVFIGWFGFDFLSAAAGTKLINFATNLSAVAYFAATDQVLYRVALPMAAFNVLGALAGSRLAMLKGNRFVRGFFLVVVVAMIVRLGWDVWGG